MTLLAISLDAPEDSRSFAADLGIWFPLLSDADGAVSRAYAGMSSDAAALPGVTVIGRDGRIAYRNIASVKDDRVSTPELLAILDRTVGTTGEAAAPSGYAAVDRMQVRLELGGGAIRDSGANHGTGVAAVGALFPLGHHVLVGPWLSFEPRQAPVDLDLAVALRQPFAGGLAAVQLTAIGGYTPWDATGWTASGRAGIWFAMSPHWAFTFDLAAGEHRLGDADSRLELSATLGVARLFRLR